jgi:adenylate kinase
VKRRIVLLGPPASGKGTQAELIRRTFQIPVTSTGAILRQEAKRGTPLGLQIQTIITGGQLAPDELIMEVVAVWMDASDGSFGFDGFPRTLPQAIGFDTLLDRRQQPLELALFLDVSEETVIRRMSTRLTCRTCGKAVTVGRQVQSKTDPCPNCRGVLEVRTDDNREALVTRLVEFRKKSLPVSDFYREHNILAVIDGDREVEQVFVDVQRKIRE